MNLAAVHQSELSRKRLASNGDLTSFFMELCDDVGADTYMLVAIDHDQDRSDIRLIACNWIWDAIHLAGHGLLARLVHGALSTAPGARAMAIESRRAPDLPGVMSGDEARLLDVLGHAEMFALRLHVGRQRLFLLLSASEPGEIRQEALGQAQLRSCYALSDAPQLLTGTATQDPLSDRERECLYWVSEGKTTDEVAVILGVSSNTVNSYIAHAIQKFSASNRAMAIATAIRSGII